MQDKHTDVGVYEGKILKKKKKERKQKRHTDENQNMDRQMDEKHPNRQTE